MPGVDIDHFFGALAESWVWGKLTRWTRDTYFGVVAVCPYSSLVDIAPGHQRGRK